MTLPVISEDDEEDASSTSSTSSSKSPTKDNNNKPLISFKKDSKDLSDDEENDTVTSETDPLNCSPKSSIFSSSLPQRTRHVGILPPTDHVIPRSPFEPG